MLEQAMHSHYMEFEVWCSSGLFQKASPQYMKISLDKRVGFPGNTSNFSTRQLFDYAICNVNWDLHITFFSISDFQ